MLRLKSVLNGVILFPIISAAGALGFVFCGAWLTIKREWPVYIFPVILVIGLLLFAFLVPIGIAWTVAIDEHADIF